MEGPYLWLGLLLGLSLLLLWRQTKKKKKVSGNRKDESLDTDFSFNPDTLKEDQLRAIAVDVLKDVPIGIAVIDHKGEVFWVNKRFLQLVKREEAKGNISYILPELAVHTQYWLAREKVIQLPLKGKVFRVERKELSGVGFVLSFEDITEKLNVDQHRQEERPVLGFIQIDNLSDTLHEIGDEKKPVLQGEIDKVLTEWALKMEGYLRKYAEDRYLLIMSQEALRECQKNRFEIMDRIRDINLGNRIPVTLSMGIGTGDEPIMDLSRLANLGLELALGRGGDQAVVKWTDKVLFYGGNSNVVEKKTKVRARVVAYTLRHFIQQAANVIVMGHESSDFDSAGASLGVAKIALDYGKPVQIILDNSARTLDNLWGIIEEYPEYAGRITSGEEAIASADQETLLVICDANKPSLLIEPGILDKVGRIILIDHHRRGEEFIPDVQLVYVEPYASSTSELVTEIIQYLGEEISLDPLVASALLAGIAVDSKNFIFQTGVRTFEAAGFLRRVGADLNLVRKFLQDDFEMVLTRAQVVQNSEILFDHIAIGYLEQVVPHNTIIAAQTADLLLSIEHIQASFVLYAVNDGVNISGRSNGEINVQVLLEELGGGGHLTVAGAQLKGIGINEARER
ncbi:MAG: DHH family phosphoesterase, partial [Dehalobacterium sp.]